MPVPPGKEWGILLHHQNLTCMINKYNSSEKATVCAGNNCVTVYGAAAQIITGVILFVVLLWALNQMAKLIG
jgi:hypothetical protein